MGESWAYLLSRPEHDFKAEAVARAVRGRNVLVTGAGGSIGVALSRRIQSLNAATLVLLDAHEASLWRLRQSLEAEASRGAGAVHYVLADLRDRPKLLGTLRRYPTDVVFHLAAYKHVALAEENVDQAVAVNLIGTLNLVEGAALEGVDVVILPTTDKTVNPTSLYGCTKRVIERLARSVSARDQGPSLRAARLVNVLGSQGSVVEVFTRQIAAGEAPSITDPRTDRYYITMDEAVGFLLAVATNPAREGVFAIDPGTPVRTTDLACRLQRELRPGEAELPIRVTGLKPGERLHEELRHGFEARRDTGFPGIDALDAPPEPAGRDEWLDVLGRLRRDLYEWDPAALREYIFALARVEHPAWAGPRVAEPER